MKINGRSMFYSWLLEMAPFFLRVEPGEREESGEGGEVERGEERLSDAGWHGNLAR